MGCITYQLNFLGNAWSTGCTGCTLDLHLAVAGHRRYGAHLRIGMHILQRGGFLENGLEGGAYAKLRIASDRCVGRNVGTVRRGGGVGLEIEGVRLLQNGLAWCQRTVQGLGPLLGRQHLIVGDLS